ncbi:hypothetical protein D3C71_1570440 [compost metagenome]
MVTTLNSRTASIDIENGAPLLLVVEPADVGFLAFIPSMVKLVDEPSCPPILSPLLKGDKSIKEVKFLPLTGNFAISFAVTEVAAPKFSI